MLLPKTKLKYIRGDKLKKNSAHRKKGDFKKRPKKGTA